MTWDDWHYHELGLSRRGGSAIAGYNRDLPKGSLRLFVNDDKEALPETIRDYCQQYLSVPDLPDGCPTEREVHVFYTADFELARKLSAPPLSLNYEFDGICQDLIDDDSGQYTGLDNLSLIKQGMLSPPPALMAVTNDALTADRMRDRRSSSLHFAIGKEPDRDNRSPDECQEIIRFFRRVEQTRKLSEDPLLSEYRYIIGPTILEIITGFMDIVDNPIGSDKEDTVDRMPIVILGETGTGKEAIARLIHLKDRGDSDPNFDRFQSVLIAGIPEGVLEGELFGVDNLGEGKLDKNNRIAGYLRLAEHGTYFQDELEDLPLSIQGKLLRFLQQKQIRPVGGDRYITLRDIRCVFAANKNLRDTDQRLFREDFLHRIDGLVLELPPLKDRPDDHEPLIQFFLGKYRGSEHCESLQPVTDDAMNLLLEQCASGAIRGNVRGLSNHIRRIIAVTPRGQRIDTRSIEQARKYSLFVNQTAN